MSTRDFFLALLTVTIWGGNVIAVKLGVLDLPPLLMTALRLSMVALMLMPFVRLRRCNLRWILLFSLTFSTLHFSLMFLGLKMAEAGTGAILLQMGTPIATLLGVAIFRESLSPLQFCGLLISFGGVVLLTFSPAIPPLLPFLLLLASALAWAISNLIAKHTPQIDMMELICWASFFGVPQVALLSYVFEHGQLQAMLNAGWIAWSSVAYCAALSSTLGYWLWYGLLRRYAIGKIMPLSLLSPVFSVFLGVLVFKDSADLKKIAGAVITVGGIVFVQYFSTSRIANAD
ncbi:putative membrane protein [Herbaspirillum sp. CF444]|uniref:DMT family transporter n=1 Tax=Herbaspirillum sp. CF444 TaxID=1144319 RepID=UPI00027251F4|nr:EamA family transporter [Herbaspirillum sp. CF444]EJL86757.1 putative membrane protein [Herbaspirillum sp. CF444]